MMTNNNDANLTLVQTELRFILTQANSNDVESAQLIAMAAESALQALFEHNLSLEEGSAAEAEFDFPAAPEGGPVLLAAAQTYGRERAGSFVIWPDPKPREEIKTVIQIMGRRQFRRAEQRARQERMMVRPVAECEYSVTNQTRGTSYRVRFLSINGKPCGSCNCLAGRPERGDAVPQICKHLYAAAVVHLALARMDLRAMGRSTRIE